MKEIVRRGLKLEIFSMLDGNLIKKSGRKWFGYEIEPKAFFDAIARAMNEADELPKDRFTGRHEVTVNLPVKIAVDIPQRKGRRKRKKPPS